MQRVAELSIAAVFADVKETLDLRLWLSGITRGVLIGLRMRAMLCRTLAMLPVATTMSAALSPAMLSATPATPSAASIAAMAALAAAPATASTMPTTTSTAAATGSATLPV